MIGKQFILVHNGIVRMPKVANYPYQGECDSEILLSHIEAYGLEKGLANLEGSAAIALLDKQANLYLFRHSSPIEVSLFKDKAGIQQLVFASTDTAIAEAVKDIAPINPFGFVEIGTGELDEDTLYKITSDLQISHVDITIKPTVYPAGYYHPNYND
jgi:glucosamine 6-phosphate synthetase-like amidotransferase/phosphosugar isomerase protein